MIDPEAAAAGAGLGAARLAVLDLRPRSGLDRALLPRVARRLLAADCAALMLADVPGCDTFTPPELASAFAPALAAARAAAADRARLARSWRGTIDRPATATTLADGRVIAASAELLRLLGIDGLESLLGRPLGTFLAGAGAAGQDGAGADGGGADGDGQGGVGADGAGADGDGVATAAGAGTAVEILRPDGGRVPARLFDRPLRRRGGLAGREIALVEIADDGGIRGALAASEQRYRLVVDALAEGVLVCAPDGKVQLWNPAAERILGVPNQGVVGRRWIDGSWELVHEDGSPFAVDDLPLARTLRSGEPHSGVVVGVRRPGGSLCWLSINSRSLGRTPGRSLGAVASFSDVTEQKRLVELLARIEHQELRLREMITRSAREWQRTFDSIAMPVLLVDAWGRVSRLNQAARRLAGESFQEMVRRQVDSLAAKGEPWCGVASLVSRRTQGAPPVAARERRVQNGRTWEIQTHPLPGDAGMIVTLHDQSDLVRLQESLRRSATMSAMGLLVAGVAHEVRNPLFGLGALLDSFESQTDPQQRFPIEPFRRGLTRVQHLMQQLLDYGQPVPRQRSRHALRKTLLEAVETCGGLAAERQVEVALAAPPDLPQVRIDEGRMLQVFSNLLDNAIRYSPAGGRVTMAAAADHDWLETHVDDAGPGVAAEDLVSVFEPFFTRRRGGTGLGLAIVQKIVVEHGGSVACCRRASGGTRMTVRLPLRETQDGGD